MSGNEPILTKADDFPIHQTPDPIAVSGTDRNFYDRYFFNGYTPDGALFFACAMGVYPHLNIIDASFSVVTDGVQTNLRASRILHMERMDLQVGPITVEVVEPLSKLRLLINAPDRGMEADLLFTKRADAIKEPRFTYRNGPRAFMDYTRLTQNGSYEGRLSVNGKTFDLAGQTVRGTRDRSWGIRPVGAPDAQPQAPEMAPQFYWLWSPLNFDDCLMFFHANEDGEGSPWNRKAVIRRLPDGAPISGDAIADIQFEPKTRHAKLATIRTQSFDGGDYTVELTPHWNFYMHGIGYGHPEWGHGRYRGELDVAHDSFATADIDESDFGNNHIQAFCTAVLTGPDGNTREGVGILEQLIVGRHAPSNFHDLFDLAR